MNRGVYYSEFDPRAAAWLRELIADGLIPDGVVDERDIRDVKADDIRGHSAWHFFCGLAGWPLALRLAGWPDDRCCVSGSPPCQGFSSAGRRKGFADERHLWPVYWRLVRELRPPVVFGEQVPAAVNHGWLDLVRADCEAEGYKVETFDIPAAAVGSPNIRQRLWICAYLPDARGAVEATAAGGVRAGIRDGVEAAKDPGRVVVPGPDRAAAEAGGTGGLADPERAERGPEHGGGRTPPPAGRGRAEAAARPERGGPDGGGADGVADADPGRRPHPGAELDAGGWTRTDGDRGHGADERLAHADDGGWRRGSPEQPGEGDGATGERPVEPGRRLPPRGLGDAVGELVRAAGHGPTAGAAGGVRGANGEWQWVRPDARPAGATERGSGGVADADGGERGRGEGRDLGAEVDPTVGEVRVPDAGGRGGHGGERVAQPAGLGNSGGEGLQERNPAGAVGEGRPGPAPVAAGDDGTGFWDDTVVIHCRDGKARRVPAEPGVQLVVDGLPDVLVGGRRPCRDRFPLTQEKHEGRVMLLKGAGNAVNPVVAAQVVLAYREANGEFD